MKYTPQNESKPLNREQSSQRLVANIFCIPHSDIRSRPSCQKPAWFCARIKVSTFRLFPRAGFRHCFVANVSWMPVIDRPCPLAQPAGHMLMPCLIFQWDINLHNSLWDTEAKAVSVFTELLPAERKCRPIPTGDYGLSNHLEMSRLTS